MHRTRIEDGPKPMVIADMELWGGMALSAQRFSLMLCPMATTLYNVHRRVHKSCVALAFWVAHGEPR